MKRVALVKAEVERITGKTVVEIWDEDVKSICFVGEDDVLAVFNGRTGKLQINH